jgi:hypothetical protein
MKNFPFQGKGKGGIDLKTKTKKIINHNKTQIKMPQQNNPNE